jgi:hypothetical protein
MQKLRNGLKPEMHIAAGIESIMATVDDELATLAELHFCRMCSKCF